MRLRSLLPCLVVALLVGAAPVLAASAEDVADQVIGGVYVEPGADADTAELQRIVADPAATNVGLSVIVLADEDADAVEQAGLLGGELRGTVLVFTPAAYGVWSGEVSQEELERVIDDAEGQLTGPVVATGVEAFVDALDVHVAESDGGINWWFIIGVAAVAAGVIGLAGSTFRRRTEPDTGTLDRRWGDLRTRADAHDDDIRALATKVPILDDEDAADTYREASGLFDRLRRALHGDPDADRIEEISRDMVRLDELVRRLEAMTASDSSTTSA